MANKTYVGNVGTVIDIDMGQDISGATTTDLYVKKPDGTEATWSGEIYGSNYIRYVIEEDDLNEAGRYYVQPYLVISDWSGYGKTVDFKVYELWR